MKQNVTLVRSDPGGSLEIDADANALR